MLLSGLSSFAEFPDGAMPGLLFFSATSFWLIDEIIDSFFGLFSSGAVAFSTSLCSFVPEINQKDVRIAMWFFVEYGNTGCQVFKWGRGDKIRKIFVKESTYPREIIELVLCLLENTYNNFL